MIHELRIYHCVPGRLPALLKRFETITLKLWERHGIRQAGFWTVAIGESNQDLYYLLEWESLAEREQKWNAFAPDPEWLAKRTEEKAVGTSIWLLALATICPSFSVSARFSSHSGSVAKAFHFRSRSASDSHSSR